MKEKTTRRGTAVSRFLMSLAISQFMADPKTGFTPIHGGMNGGFTGAPIYTPKRTKFKGYMRSDQYKSKH